MSDNKWLRFGLGAVVALVLLFGLVFEINIPVFEPVAEPGSEFGSQAVRERIAIDSRDDVYLFNGADLYSYSDDHSTQKFHVDGATGALDSESTGNFAGALTLQAGVVGSQDVENVMFPSVLSVPITYTAAAGGTGVVATIADGEIWLVHAVLVQVTTNFDATGDDASLVVGDGNDPDGFIVLADAELQAADTEGTGFAAGWQGMSAATLGAYLDLNHNAYVYAPSGAAETIDWLVDETSGETLTAGAATIYVIYTRIK